MILFWVELFVKAFLNITSWHDHVKSKTKRSTKHPLMVMDAKPLTNLNNSERQSYWNEIVSYVLLSNRTTYGVHKKHYFEF